MKVNWYDLGWVRIHFLGAAKMVSGSCILIEIIVKGETHYFMVDCGLFQGRFSGKNYLNDLKFPVDVAKIKYLFLTHAHTDHDGRMPKLYKDGFRGRIITTEPTIDLCKINLPDCAKIQEAEMAQINKKRVRAGREQLEPLYTIEDANTTCKYLTPIEYNQKIKYEDWLSVKYIDAGHMLGSASAVLYLNNGEEELVLLFSGDIGHESPILEKPMPAYVEADYIFMESTYGGRIHKPSKDDIEKFIDIVASTIEKGGNVIIPAFAVGRTQEIIFKIFESENHKNDPRCELIYKTPVYVDSPMAISATQIFRKHRKYLNAKVNSYFEQGKNPLDFPTLHLVRDSNESMKLNDDKIPKIIISASGMCEAGRIKHHLKHNLWRPESTVVFVGYQALGTLGRRILDGEKKVKIYGEEIMVNAKVEYLEGLSGHADQNELINWIKGIQVTTKNIFLIHGEPEQQNALQKRIIDEMPNVSVTIPILKSSYVFNKNNFSEYIEDLKSSDVTKVYPGLSVLSQIHELNDSIDTFRDTINTLLKQGIDEFQHDALIDGIKDMNNYFINFFNNNL